MSVKQITKIARLFVSDVQKFEASLENVLNWLNDAKKVDVSSCKSYNNDYNAGYREYATDDNPKFLEREKLLKNLPNATKDGFISIPKVIGSED